MAFILLTVHCTLYNRTACQKSFQPTSLRLYKFTLNISIAMKYDLLSPTPPPMPKRLPGFIKHTISKVPEYMHPAAANSLFPPASALMSNVTFRFIDNTIHEPGSKMEGCVAQSGMGKSYLDAMIEAIIRSLRQNDEISDKKLSEYSRLYNSKGSNKDKPERPEDAPIFVLESDTTNAALIQLLKDAERAGNRSLYSTLAELDLLNQFCGGHNQMTRVIRLNYDTKRYGAHRATTQGISGHPFLRWRFNFSCVQSKAQKFFKSCMTDGTLGRIGFTYLPKPSYKQKTKRRQGNYDEAYLEKLDEYLIRLQAACGEIKVPRINTLVNRLDDELNDIALLADDDDFQALCLRAVGIGWQKGCLLYVAEGYRWTQEIEDFVEWSVYNDLWSKIAIFYYEIKETQKFVEVDKRKYGPMNMMELLNDSFTKDMLEQLRLSLHKASTSSNLLSSWMSRGYLTYDESTGLYHKTDVYYQKYPKT